MDNIHKIKFTGCHPHNGEYWYECVKCGYSDWCASYGEPENLFKGIPCKSKK